MNPLWRPIPDFPAYEVSASGRVRSADTHYVLTPRKGLVALRWDGKAHRCAVRDLVAAAWAEDSGNGMKVSDVKPSSGVDHASKPDRTAVCLVTLAPAASAALLDLAGEYDCLAVECAGLAWEKEQLQADLVEAQTANTRLETKAHRMKAAYRETVGKLLGQIAELKGRDARSIEELAERRGIMARMDADNANLRKEIAKLKARPTAKPATAALSADEKDAEIARLRTMVAELEAELALYRASASI